MPWHECVCVCVYVLAVIREATVTVRVATLPALLVLVGLQRPLLPVGATTTPQVVTTAPPAAATTKQTRSAQQRVDIQPPAVRRATARQTMTSSSSSNNHSSSSISSHNSRWVITLRLVVLHRDMDRVLTRSRLLPIHSSSSKHRPTLDTRSLTVLTCR